MKAEREGDDEFLMREFDFSKGVRGKYAHRFTPESREAFYRESAYGMVEEITSYALRQIRELEEALFTLILLCDGDPPLGEVPRDLAGLMALVGGRRLLEHDLACRIQALVAEREWLLCPRDEVYTGPGSFSPLRVRLEGIYNEARGLKEQVEELVERHLARSGMSEQEIDRKTEETARLWQAA